MSIVEDYNNLPNKAKIFVVALLIVIPFWIVAIYLFDKPLFDLGSNGTLLLNHLGGYVNWNGNSYN